METRCYVVCSTCTEVLALINRPAIAHAPRTNAACEQTESVATDTWAVYAVATTNDADAFFAIDTEATLASLERCKSETAPPEEDAMVAWLHRQSDQSTMDGFLKRHTGHASALMIDPIQPPWWIGQEGWAQWREDHDRMGEIGMLLPRNLVADRYCVSWRHVLLENCWRGPEFFGADWAARRRELRLAFQELLRKEKGIESDVEIAAVMAWASARRNALSPPFSGDFDPHFQGSPLLFTEESNGTLAAGGFADRWDEVVANYEHLLKQGRLHEPLEAHSSLESMIDRCTFDLFVADQVMQQEIEEVNSKLGVGGDVLFVAGSSNRIGLVLAGVHRTVDPAAVAETLTPHDLASWRELPQSVLREMVSARNVEIGMPRFGHLAEVNDEWRWGFIEYRGPIPSNRECPPAFRSLDSERCPRIHLAVMSFLDNGDGSNLKEKLTKLNLARCIGATFHPFQPSSLSSFVAYIIGEGRKLLFDLDSYRIIRKAMQDPVQESKRTEPQTSTE